MRQGEKYEDLIGGRVLAWVGGLSVLIGIVLLLAIAVSNGWIGEGVRTALAGLGSAALLGAGIWLHEYKGHMDAALAALAAGIAGSFATVTVAAQVYELIPTGAAMALAVGVGALAAALAVRWKSQGIAALGIVGGLCAPLLAGGEIDGGSVVILFVALCAAAGVLLHQRWDWLAFTAFVVSVPQWLVYIFDGASPTAALTALAAFGALGTVVAVGYDVRRGADAVRLPSAFLLAFNAIVLGAAGWYFLDGNSLHDGGIGWLACLAAVHAALGVAGPRVARLSRDLSLLSLTIGVLLADVAFALVADGPVLAIGWTVTTVAFAVLMRRTQRGAGVEQLVGCGLGGHLALAMTAAMIVDDPLAVVAGDAALTAAGAVAVAVLAAGCLVSARLADGRGVEWRIALDGVGLGAVVLLTAMVLDGPALVFAWLLEAVVLASIGNRHGDDVAACGSVSLLAFAATHVLLHDTPAGTLVTGFAAPLTATATLGALAGAAFLAARLLASFEGPIGPVLYGSSALVLLYLGSGLVVTPFESGDAVGSTMLSAHQQGQMVLSVFWAVVGVGALFVGLQRDLGVVRVAALGLLGAAVVKVFLFDLASLTSIYRVVSFIGLGLLLLLGAYVWQRLRPRLPADMRETPEALR